MNLYDILRDTPNLNVTINAGQFIECIDYAASIKNGQFETEGKEQEKLYTAVEACDYLRITKPTLHRWKKEGIIPHVRIGRNIRYRGSDLKEIIEKKK